MNDVRFDIADAILSLHGIALWCAISGVICVIDGDARHGLPILRTGIRIAHHGNQHLRLATVGLWHA